MAAISEELLYDAIVYTIFFYFKNAGFSLVDSGNATVKCIDSFLAELNRTHEHVEDSANVREETAQD